MCAGDTLVRTHRQQSSQEGEGRIVWSQGDSRWNADAATVGASKCTPGAKRT